MGGSVGMCIPSSLLGEVPRLCEAEGASSPSSPPGGGGGASPREGASLLPVLLPPPLLQRPQYPPQRCFRVALKLRNSDAQHSKAALSHEPVTEQIPLVSPRVRFT